MFGRQLPAQQVPSPRSALACGQLARYAQLSVLDSLSCARTLLPTLSVFSAGGRLAVVCKRGGWRRTGVWSAGASQRALFVLSEATSSRDIVPC